MSKQKKNDLVDVIVERIDVVPAGGNKKKIFIRKGVTMADEFTTESLQELEEVIKEESEKESEYLEEIQKQKVSDAAKNAVKGALRLMNKYKEEIGVPALQKLAALAGYGYAEPKKQEPMKPEDEEKKFPFKKSYVEVKKSIQGFVPQDKREDFDKLMKGVEVEDTPITDDPQVLALQKERAEDKVRIEKMEKELDTRKYETRIKKELPNLTTTPEKFAPLYMKIEKALDDSEKKEFSEILKSADTLAEKSETLMKELGSNQDNPQGGTYEKIMKMAEEKVKADPKLTIEKAESMVLEENPKLYDEYNKDA